MISIKRGTQAWSPAQQQSSLEADKSKALSPEDQAKYFGEENIGEVLNKVADPNWVDPAKLRKVGNSDLGKDAFLKLLLAQMQNQDPTTPMESHEMAAQLAQFTSLEKLTDINDGIGKMTKAQGPDNKFELLNLIGKAVSGDSSKVIRSLDTDIHDVSFSLMGNATQADVKIRNGQGEVIRTQRLTQLKDGKNSFTWNGLNDNGEKASMGEYEIIVEAKDISGKRVHAETTFEGVVSGVNFTAAGPVLMSGNQKIKMSDVKKIVDPSLLKGKVVNQATMEAPKPGAVKNAPTADTSKLEANIAMSREMMNKLDKETGKQ